MRLTCACFTLVDMLADELACLNGQPAIPVGQQRVEYQAGLPAGAGDQERTESSFQVGASMHQQSVRPATGSDEHGRDFGFVETVPDA
jgi:hypothetical protein